MSSSGWTKEQNKAFEEALVSFKDKPDWWENVAALVGGGKTVDELKRHYEKLLKDVKAIEDDKFPVPDFKSDEDTTTKEGGLKK
ncbi:hypothetical protein ACS0TY_036474 [Phlomoides rotata]